MHNVSAIRDYKNAATVTTGGTPDDFAHPRIIYPSNYNIAPFAAAATEGGGLDWPTFQSRGFRSWNYA